MRSSKLKLTALTLALALVLLGCSGCGGELGTQGQGEIVTWTAEKAGAFPYSCTIHPSMTGEIIVK